MKHTVIGNVGTKGAMNIYGIDQLNEFLSKNIGKTFSFTIETEEKSSSKALIMFYKNKIVLDFKKAFIESGEHLSESMVATRLDELSPFVEDGTAYQLKQPEMMLHIDFCRLLAAREFSFFIDDPRTV